MSDTQTNRRTFLKISAATGLAVGATALGATPKPGTATSAPAKAGDVLLYQDGPNKGKPVKAADLKAGTAVWAIVADPATKKPRDATKSAVVIVKLPSGKIKASSKPNAVGDVVAYSSVCTHQGCPAKQLGDVGAGKGNIICTCHGSIYDPADNATVLGGPAPKRLAALPLKLDATGQLTAGAPFTGNIGPKK